MNLQQVHVLNVHALQRGLNSREDRSSRQTALVDVILGLGDLLAVGDGANIGSLSNVTKAFGENDQLMARDVVLFDRLSNDFFAYAVGVDLAFVSLRSFATTCSLTFAVSHVLRPLSYAALSNGRASSSSITHGCHFCEPKLIAPKMGTETRRPLLPRRLYSALVSSMDC